MTWLLKLLNKAFPPKVGPITGFQESLAYQERLTRKNERQRVLSYLALYRNGVVNPEEESYGSAT